MLTSTFQSPWVLKSRDHVIISPRQRFSAIVEGAREVKRQSNTQAGSPRRRQFPISHPVATPGRHPLAFDTCTLQD